MFKHGIDLKVEFNEGFKYNSNSFGPITEIRYLEDIRKSLKDPDSQGPEALYKIAMDIGNKVDYHSIVEHNLLYGSVAYNKGTIGNEPIRSQGHIHAVSPSCNYSTPEVYEIWSGEAIIYMQEYAKDNPGRCYAIEASVGDVVIVPPNWAHATVSASKSENLIFGAWCVRDFGFEYDDVREHQGLAWYPIYKNDELLWEQNSKYLHSKLCIKRARNYSEFGIVQGISIYNQFVDDNSKFDFVSNPQKYQDIWETFTP